MVEEIKEQVRVARAEVQYNIAELPAETLLTAIELSIRNPNGPVEPGGGQPFRHIDCRTS